MTEKTLNICDNCNEKVAKSKCAICDCDVCDNCNQELTFGMEDSFDMFGVNMCDKCSEKFTDLDDNEKRPELDKDTQKIILDYMRNILTLEGLKEKKEVKTRAGLGTRLKQMTMTKMQSRKLKGGYIKNGK